MKILKYLLIIAFFLHSLAYSQNQTGIKSSNKKDANNSVANENRVYKSQVFLKKISVVDSLINKNLGFANCLFNGGFLIDNSTFNSTIYYYGSEFKENVVFQKSIFKSDFITFDNCIFNGNANFFQSEVKGDFNFQHCVFLGNANFWEAKFDKKTDFTLTKFYKSVTFNYCELPDEIYFNGANLSDLQGDIDFRNSSTNGIKQRNNIKDGKCYINLIGVDASKFILPYEKFGLTFFPGVDYRKNELKNVNSLSFIPTFEDTIIVYEQIIKKCRDLGMLESVKGWDIEYQKIKNLHDYHRIGRSLNWLNEYWWNFGYDKIKIFRNTILAYFIIFLIYFSFFDYFRKVYLPEKIGVNDSEAGKLKIKTHFWERMKVVLFYTALIFFSWKMDHSEVKYRSYPTGTFIIYLTFILGIIHLAYLAGTVLKP